LNTSFAFAPLLANLDTTLLADIFSFLLRIDQIGLDIQAGFLSS